MKNFRGRLFLVFALIFFLTGCGADYLQPTSGKGIVAFGDSLTAGYGISAIESYPTQLAGILGETVVNSGVSGDTTAEALMRLDTDVLSLSPRIVIVALGGNDSLQRVDPDITFANLEVIVSRVQETGAGVVLIGVRGGLHNAEYKKRFESLAHSKKVPYLPDSLKGIFGKRELMYDTLHPNAAGYKIFIQRLLPLIEELQP